MDAHRCFTALCLGRVDLTSRVKSASHLDAEVAHDRSVRLVWRLVVHKDVMAARPQPGLSANEIPYLADRGAPRCTDSASSDVAPDCCELAGRTVSKVTDAATSSMGAASVTVSWRWR